MNGGHCRSFSHLERQNPLYSRYNRCLCHDGEAQETLRSCLDKLLNSETVTFSAEVIDHLTEGVFYRNLMPAVHLNYRRLESCQAVCITIQHLLRVLFAAQV